MPTARTPRRVTSGWMARPWPRGCAATWSALGWRHCLRSCRSLSQEPIWFGGPSIPVALAVLAIAQMGIHLVFFLHINTGPDNVNNVMALAFGVLIVILVIVGSLWIVGHLNANMPQMDQIMQMQR